MADEVIWKYPLSVTGFQHINMPVDARLLAVQVQRGVPCIWAAVPVHPFSMETVTVWIVGTGHFPIPKEGQYVGSFQLENETFVGHVFFKKGEGSI